MNFFWKYCVFISSTLSVIFLTLLISGIYYDNGTYIRISKTIININIIQLILGLILLIIKFKNKTKKYVYSLIKIFIILCAEIFLYFGLLAGLLG